MEQYTREPIFSLKQSRAIISTRMLELRLYLCKLARPRTKSPSTSFRPSCSSLKPMTSGFLPPNLEPTRLQTGQWGSIRIVSAIGQCRYQYATVVDLFEHGRSTFMERACKATSETTLWDVILEMPPPLLASSHPSSERLSSADV
jgi:hypothetical protein